MGKKENNPVTTVAMITRRLKKGKTYEDFRKVWYHTTGFGVSGQGKNGENRMYTLVNLFDPREIIVLGFTKTTVEEFEKALKVEVKFRGENPMDEVIEPEIGRSFGMLISEDNFSSEGEIAFKPASIDGTETDLVQFNKDLEYIMSLFAEAGKKRDAINAKRQGK